MTISTNSLTLNDRENIIFQDNVSKRWFWTTQCVLSGLGELEVAFCNVPVCSNEKTTIPGFNRLWNNESVIPRNHHRQYVITIQTWAEIHPHSTQEALSHRRNFPEESGTFSGTLWVPTLCSQTPVQPPGRRFRVGRTFYWVFWGGCERTEALSVMITWVMILLK